MQATRKILLPFILICIFGIELPTKTHAQIPPSNIMTLAWNPDGTLIAAGGMTGLLQIYDASAQIQFEFSNITEDIYSVVWSPDGTKIATGGTDKIVRIWNIQDPNYEPYALIAELSGHEDTILSVAWSPDSANLMSVSRSEYYTMRLWDAVNFQSDALRQYQISNLFAAAWSPDGYTVILSSEVGLFIFSDPFAIDIADLGVYLFGEFIHTQAMAQSGNGGQLVAGTRVGEVYILDMSSHAIWNTFDLHSHWVYSAAWNPINNLITTLAYDEPITIWDANTGSVIREISTGFYGAAAWSPNGEWLAYTDVNGTLKLMPAPILATTETTH